MLILLLSAVTTAAAAEPQSAVVIVPVADVWSRPIALGEKPSDDLRETQVLFGEKVIIHESSGSWVNIEAVEQPEFTHHNKWEGYPGWVLRKALKSPPLPWPATLDIPIDVIQNAESLAQTPYLWGGLSKQGIDCSGLVHLVFRQHLGPSIPRDAHEQWMKAKPIKRAELKPADLIFSAKKENPKKITHVAIYAGEGMIIEAPQTGMVVRKISFKEKYGRPLEKVESGDQVGDRIIYFGSYLHDGSPADNRGG